MVSLALDICETQTSICRGVLGTSTGTFLFGIKASNERMSKVKVTSSMCVIAGADARHSPLQGEEDFKPDLSRSPKSHSCLIEQPRDTYLDDTKQCV